MRPDLNATVPMSRLASHVTMHVTVTGARTYAWRLRVAAWLLWLAAFVAGTGIEIHTGGSDAA